MSLDFGSETGSGTSGPCPLSQVPDLLLESLGLEVGLGGLTLDLGLEDM